MFWKNCIKSQNRFHQSIKNCLRLLIKLQFPMLGLIWVNVQMKNVQEVSKSFEEFYLNEISPATLCNYKTIYR